MIRASGMRRHTANTFIRTICPFKAGLRLKMTPFAFPIRHLDHLRETRQAFGVGLRLAGSAQTSHKRSRRAEHA
jgi:hypothetical protein